MKHIAIFGIGDDIDKHIKQITNNGQFILSGIYDNNVIAAKNVANKYGIKYYSYPLDAIGQNDIIDFASPHILDIENAKLAIKCNKDLLIESNFLKNTDRVQELINVNFEAGVNIFIANKDFHNPIIKKSIANINNLSFIEVRRGLTNTDPENSQQQLLNLLYQELSLSLGFVKANCKKINVISNSLDINNSNLVNTRLEFDNGVVISINISNIASKNYREYAIFKDDGLIQLDIENSELRILSKDGKEEFYESYDKYQHNDYIENSFKAFYPNKSDNYINGGIHEVSQALDILDKIESKLTAFSM